MYVIVNLLLTVVAQEGGDVPEDSAMDVALPGAASLRSDSVTDSKEGVASAVPMETGKAGEGVEPELEGPMEQRTVFVSNLPSAVTKSQLKERFAEVGSK